MNQERRHTDEGILAELSVLSVRFDNLDEKLDRIYEQVSKTNGRVTTLEMENAENRGKAKIQGAIWGAGTSVLVALFVKLFR